MCVGGYSPHFCFTVRPSAVVISIGATKPAFSANCLSSRLVTGLLQARGGWPSLRARIISASGCRGITTTLSVFCVQTFRVFWPGWPLTAALESWAKSEKRRPVNAPNTKISRTLAREEPVGTSRW